jgi:tetratricopeptide (TPR) repeat protein
MSTTTPDPGSSVRAEHGARRDALLATLAANPERHDVALELARVHFLLGDPLDATKVLHCHCLQDRACGDELREYLIGERLDDQAMSLVSMRHQTATASAWVDLAIRKHHSRDFIGALEACQRALALEPNEPTAHNHRGRALFNLGRAEEAKAAFLAALGIDPNYAQAQCNLGHVMRAEGNVEHAERAFAAAVALAPRFRAAQFGLGTILFAQGQLERAAACFDAVVGDAPADIPALMHAGMCAHARRETIAARVHYEAALAIDPRNVPAMRFLGLISEEVADTDAAVGWFRKALAVDPRDATTWSDLIASLEQSNRIEQAETALAQANAVCADHPAVRLEAARLARRRGDETGALALLHGIDVARLSPQRRQLCLFEFGQVFDRIGEYDSALAAFANGNAMAADSPRARSLDHSYFPRQLAAISAWVERGAPMPASEPDEDRGADLCFLLGFARSGTTLLDVMLAAHPQVISLEERPTIEYVWDFLDNSEQGYPGALETMNREARETSRGIYREALRRHAVPSGTGSLIVDKMPMRTPHVALIHRLFPDARIVFAARHPADVVLSNFMQNYTLSEIYCHFFTLGDTVKIYQSVIDLWRLTVARLDLPHHVLRYEALLADPQRTLQSLCGWLNLDFDAAMLDHRSALSARDRIRTNSYHQVAEAINTRGLGRWINYVGALRPFLPALDDASRSLGYPVDDGVQRLGGVAATDSVRAGP